MKKILILAVTLLVVTNSFAKKLQFNVDMTGQVKSANGIHVMGDFQTAAGFGANSTPNTCTMVQDAVDTNLFHFTVEVPAFQKYEFLYVNGDQSYEVEVVAVESRVGYNNNDNRWIYVDSLNTDTLKLPAFVFGANCAQGMNMIRFKVDMTSQTSTTDGIHVAGNFQGNDPATTRMYSFGNNVFEIISYMTLGNYSYKYYSGNTISTEETVPSACATSGARALTLGVDTVLDVVCFSSCGTCYPTLVNTIKKETSVQIFPNPMNEEVTIEFNDQSKFHNVIVVDMTGREVKKYSQVQGASLRMYHNGLNNGMYTLQVMNEAGVATSHKLIVE